MIFKSFAVGSWLEFECEFVGVPDKVQCAGGWSVGRGGAQNQVGMMVKMRVLGHLLCSGNWRDWHPPLLGNSMSSPQAAASISPRLLAIQPGSGKTDSRAGNTSATDRGRLLDKRESV